MINLKKVSQTEKVTERCRYLHKIYLIIGLIIVVIMLLVIRNWSTGENCKSQRCTSQYLKPTKPEISSRGEPALSIYISEDNDIVEIDLDSNSISKGDLDKIVPSEVEELNVQSTTELHIEKLFQGIIDKTIENCPTRVKYLRRILQMNTSNFGLAQNERIQSIIEQHNMKVSAISEMKFTGECQWFYQNEDRTPNLFKMDYLREGFTVTFSCGIGHTICQNGVAKHSESWDESCLDSYYLFPLAVYDPIKYRTIEETDINIVDLNSGKQILLEVYKIISPERILYFRRNSVELVRVSLNNSKKEHTRIDFSEYIKLDKKTTYPLRTQVTFMDRTHYEKVDLPIHMQLQIDCESIDCNIKSTE